MNLQVTEFSPSPQASASTLKMEKSNYAEPSATAHHGRRPYIKFLPSLARQKVNMRKQGHIWPAGQCLFPSRPQTMPHCQPCMELSNCAYGLVGYRIWPHSQTLLFFPAEKAPPSARTALGSVYGFGYGALTLFYFSDTIFPRKKASTDIPYRLSVFFMLF